MDQPTIALTGERKTKLVRTIERTDVHLVSFDLFDTLVYRDVLDPDDLFEFLPRALPGLSARRAAALVGMRRDAERSIRLADKAAGDLHDPTLDRIYEEVARRAEGAGLDLAAVKALEKRLEIEHCRPRTALTTCFEYAKAIGKPVIVTTDTYLDRDTVGAILSGCGLGGYERLFVSSELRKTKKKGDIFPFVAETMGIKPRNCLQIGDNAQSDVLNAEANGWLAIKTPAARDGLVQNGAPTSGLVPRIASTRSIRPMPSRLSLGMINAEVYARTDGIEPNASPELNFETFGFVALGPFLLSLALWITRLSARQGTDELHFLARDGHLPLAACRLLTEAGVIGGETKHAYLPISRRAIFPVMMAEPGGIETILGIKAAANQDVGNFLRKRLGEEAASLVAEDPRVAALPENTLLRDVRPVVEACVLERRDAITAMTARAAERARSYYASRIDASSRAALFDVGRKGTFQAVLSDLTGAALHGFYVVTDPVIHANAPGGRFDAFLGMIDPVLRKKNPDTVTYEVLLSEQDGTVTGFTDALEPIRAPSRPNADIVAVQDGAMRYVGEALRLFGDDVRRLEQEPEHAAFALENWPRNEQAVALLKRVEHEDDVSLPNRRSLHDYFDPAARTDPWLAAPARSAKKRVAIYSPALTRIRGGAERVAAKLSWHLAGRGMEVLMLSSGREGASEAPVYDLPPGTAVRNVDTTKPERLTALLRSWDCDAAIVLASGSVVIPLGIALTEAGTPYVLSERAAPGLSLKAYWKGYDLAAYQQAHDCADAVVVQFAAFADAFPAEMRPRITVIGNPIETVSPVTEPRSRTIVCVGRVWFDQKRQDVLLDAFAMIADRHPDWRLALYGHPYEDHDARLTERAEGYGLAERVEIHPATRDIEAVFRTAGLMCMPSAFEGFPNALAEALSHGLPAVGFSSCPGVAELIEDGVAGLLVEDADITALADVRNLHEDDHRLLARQRAVRLAAALSSLMGDDARRAAMAERAPATLAPYEASAVMATWDALLAPLLERDGGFAFARQRAAVLRALRRGRARDAGPAAEALTPPEAAAPGAQLPPDPALAQVEALTTSLAGPAGLSAAPPT